MDEDSIAFLQWLRDNGARFPKIDWPVLIQESGIRGTVATDDIATNESIVEIPMQLMISSAHYDDSDINYVFEECSRFLHGDYGLSWFIMHERGKKEKSFWYPYFRILYTPETICDWNDLFLNELQDEKLAKRAKDTTPNLLYIYGNIMTMIRRLYGDSFDGEAYSFENFKFAWDTIKVRAFGRRLPYNALVPLADCLNHNNVQTKYELKNGVFRLFPTGSNRYFRGCEVFNSYGRRDNVATLMNYGFSLLDNEHSTIRVDINKIVENDKSFEDKKRKLVYLYGLPLHRSFNLALDQFSIDMVILSRILVSEELPDGDVETLFRSPISLPNEIASLKHLKLSLERNLSTFPTTLEEDTFLLEHAETARKESDLSLFCAPISNGIAPSSHKFTYLLSLINDFSDLWRLIFSLRFRVTNKRIIVCYLMELEHFINFLKLFEQLSLTHNDQTASALHPMLQNKLYQIRQKFPRWDFYISQLESFFMKYTISDVNEDLFSETH